MRSSPAILLAAVFATIGCGSAGRCRSLPSSNENPPLLPGRIAACQGDDAEDLHAVAGLLGVPDEEVRWQAAARIARWKGQATAIARDLQHAPDPTRRIGCALLLGVARDDPAGALPILAALMGDRNLQVRSTAITSTGHYGAVAGGAARTLLAQALDTDIGISHFAKTALAEVAVTDVAVLIEVLGSRDLRTRLAASEAVERMQGCPSGLVPTLVRALGDADPFIATRAYDCLKRSSPPPVAALKALVSDPAAEGRNLALALLLPPPPK